MTGCATSGAKPALFYPELPADLRLCFDSPVAKPKAGPMTKADVLTLVSKLQLSETEKIERCERLIFFNDSLQSSRERAHHFPLLVCCNVLIIIHPPQR